MKKRKISMRRPRRLRRFYKPPPVRDVTVVDTPPYISIYIERFDKKLLDMIHKFGKGIYQPLPVRHWMFPGKRKEEIIRAFRTKGYYVHIFNKDGKQLS